MALVAACVSSFAQGKVLFGNDANHLIMLPSSIPAGSIWSSQAGLAIAQEGGANPNNISLLTAELWAGTSAANMSLQRTLTGNATGQAGFNDGRLSQNNTILTGVPAGVGFFQIRIWETSAGSWAAASQVPGLRARRQSSAPLPGPSRTTRLLRLVLLRIRLGQTPRSLWPFLNPPASRWQVLVLRHC